MTALGDCDDDQGCKSYVKQERKHATLAHVTCTPLESTTNQNIMVLWSRGTTHHADCTACKSWLWLQVMFKSNFESTFNSHLCAREVPVEVLLRLQVPHLTLKHAAATVGQHGGRQTLTSHLTPAHKQATALASRCGATLTSLKSL